MAASHFHREHSTGSSPDPAAPQGGGLTLIGIYQLLYLLTLKKSLRQKAGWFSYLLPVVILLIGILILANPFSATERVLVVAFGSAILLYGITDLWYYLRLR